MGDPGLVAGDLPGLALPHRARAQRGEVGAGVGLGEDRRRQDLARGDAAAAIAPSAPRCRRRGSARPRSPSACRASRRRYSRARAPPRRRTSRPSTGPCRRIPPGSSGRRRRARPSSRSTSSGMSRCRGASRAHAASTSASPKRRISLRIASSVSSRPASPTVAAPCASRISATSRARAAGVLPVGDQGLDGVGARSRDRLARAKAERRQAHDLALAHRNAAEDLRRDIRRAPMRTSSSSVSPKRPSACRRSRIGRELAHRLGIGREPGEAVRRMLMAIELLRGEPTVPGDEPPDRPGRLADEGRDACGRRPAEGEQVRSGCRRGRRRGQGRLLRFGPGFGAVQHSRTVHHRKGTDRDATSLSRQANCPRVCRFVRTRVRA